MTKPTGGQEDDGRLKHKQDGQVGKWSEKHYLGVLSVLSMIVLAFAQHLLDLNLKPELHSGEPLRGYICSLRGWSYSSVRGMFP